jgi:DNA anti-recombination protein RmuC
MALTCTQELNNFLTNNEQNKKSIQEINSNLATLNSDIDTLKTNLQGVQQSIDSLSAQMNHFLSQF